MELCELVCSVHQCILNVRIHALVPLIRLFKVITKL